ncbi:MAG: 30S ribosomal protein S21 [Paludibaculum sp.]
MKLRNFYEKPSEKKARQKAEAVRRARKLARKRAQREGGLPSPGGRCPRRSAKSIQIAFMNAASKGRRFCYRAARISPCSCG